MKFDISAEVLNETNKCKEDFSCLKGEETCLCEIEDSFNNKIFFVKSLNNGACRYKMSFGYSYICHCPTRQAIFRNYRK